MQSDLQLVFIDPALWLESPNGLGFKDTIRCLGIIRAAALGAAEAAGKARGGAVPHPAAGILRPILRICCAGVSTTLGVTLDCVTVTPEVVFT